MTRSPLFCSSATGGDQHAAPRGAGSPSSAPPKPKASSGADSKEKVKEKVKEPEAEAEAAPPAPAPRRASPPAPKPLVEITSRELLDESCYQFKGFCAVLLLPGPLEGEGKAEVDALVAKFAADPIAFVWVDTKKARVVGNRERISGAETRTSSSRVGHSKPE